MRTVTLTAKVSAATHCRLDPFLRQQTELWNAALAERIDAYQKVGKTVTSYDQCKSLTAIRGAEERFRQFPVQPQRTVLFRLDKAFKSFFRRVKRSRVSRVSRAVIEASAASIFQSRLFATARYA